ncbi:hypothetical protein ACGFZS_09715 [Streptomyces sp. NPDC048288]|uniref:hypothetical protein n=1 Tax=Streptomyces sp. NPDC048288 TaxID=3365529 RepID=UPI003717F111
MSNSITTLYAVCCLISVANTVFRLIRPRYNTRWSLGLSVITNAIMCVSAIMHEVWPWDLVSLITTLVLIGLWVAVPSKKTPARDPEQPS